MRPARGVLSRPRARARLGALACAVAALLACGGPADPGRTRPQAAAATPLPQGDLVLAALGGLRVRYVDVGPRQPDAAGLPLLLIPGHTSRIEEYDGLVPRLAERRRVLVFDFPGSGYSDKPLRRYDLAFYEDAAVAFLDARGVGRAHLAGGSLGGNLVLRLGHRFPERFARLAPWAPASAWQARPWLARLIRAAGGRALFWPSVRIQSRYWYADAWPGREAALADTFAYYDEVMSPGFVAMYFGMAADQVGHSLFDLAGGIHQPVWLGWGDLDHGANMGEGVARLHTLLPDSTLRVFPGARHSLALEIPEALAREVGSFLAPE